MSTVTQHYCGKDRLIDFNRKFVVGMVAIANHTMRELTGKGCRLNSLKRTGKGDDRRKDKLEDGLPKAFRAYRNRYA